MNNPEPPTKEELSEALQALVWWVKAIVVTAVAVILLAGILSGLRLIFIDVQGML